VLRQVVPSNPVTPGLVNSASGRFGSQRDGARRDRVPASSSGTRKVVIVTPSALATLSSVRTDGFRPRRSGSAM
jgi:hypothetical protein